VSIIGRRIRLNHTDDQYAMLRSGDMGTITDITEIPKMEGMFCPETQIWVSWDNYSNLAMIVGKDDFEILENE
jgi:Domain of unknown function (DUF4314)